MKKTLILFTAGLIVFLGCTVPRIATMMGSKDADTAKIENTITDINGNVYQTVKIGSQIWTAVNIRTTKYTDGTPIAHVPNADEWGKLNSPAYCFYDNKDYGDSIEQYGALYNWYVVDPSNLKKIAPEGWRVPTDADWTTLENYLSSNGKNWDKSTSGNKIAKSMASSTGIWQFSSTAGSVGNDQSGNNSSGFSGFPGGYRNEIGEFYDMGRDAIWWSDTKNTITDAWNRSLTFGDDNLKKHSTVTRLGLSVRLVKE